MFASGRIYLNGGEIAAVTPDAVLHYLRRKTSKDMYPLRGLGADHVLNGRKRAEALLKQVMLSSAEQIGIGIGCLGGGSSLTLSYQLDKGV